jgi:branched-chain amino acid transport system permease protein
MPWLRSSLALHAAALAVLLVLPLVFGGLFSLGVITMMYFWAAAALAWNLSGGYAGQLSLGHAAFLGIGAYTSTLLYLRLGISPWLGMLAGAALAGLIALLIAAITMRLKGTFFVMATLVFAVVAHITAINWRGLTNGTQGLVIPLDAGWSAYVFRDKLPYAYIALGLLAINYGITRWIAASKAGYALVAYRENDDAARALGIRTLRVRVSVFVLSAMLTALCGTFHAQYFLYLDPDGVFSLAFSLQLALLAIVGGIGTAYGPILGAMIITPLGLLLQASVGNAVAGLHLFIYATIVIVVLMALPEGVGPGLLARWARRTSR